MEVITLNNKKYKAGSIEKIIPSATVQLNFIERGWDGFMYSIKGIRGGHKKCLRNNNGEYFTF